VVVAVAESDVVSFRMSNEQIKQILEESINKTGLKPKSVDVKNGEVVVVYDLVSILNRVTPSYGVAKIEADEGGITIYVKRKVIGVG
jgi:uncharacterized radical SAM superfamily Fe-S cluster-containing enzyme